METVIVLLIGLVLYLLVKHSREANRLNDGIRTEIAERERLAGIVEQFNQDEAKLGPLDVRIAVATAELERVNEALRQSEGLLDQRETIIYPRRFPEDTSEQLKERMKQIKDRQSDIRRKGQVVIQFGEAAQARLSAEEKRKLRALVRLGRLALEGAADTLLDQVKASNLSRLDAKFKTVVADLNRTLQPWGFEIGKNYQGTVRDSLELMSEHQQQVEKEREEQRALREQMREEAAALREAERAEREAESEARRAERDLLKAREAADKATVEERSKWLDKVQQLEAALSLALTEKERAKSMAQLTKSGHIYVISNVGSFGEDVYKVGMTRRLDPYDRIQELGDASVPFPFDIHGMIRCDDAPALEKALHTTLGHHRMNLVNERKEFFAVPLEEIQEVVTKHGFTVELSLAAEAVQYRQSVAMRKGLVFEQPTMVDEKGAEDPDEVE